MKQTQKKKSETNLCFLAYLPDFPYFLSVLFSDQKMQDEIMVYKEGENYNFCHGGS